MQRDIRACELCADTLPLGPRPVVQFSNTARVVVAGQAPGARVHKSGVPFDDPSGDRLRAWMGVEKEVFYDASKIAIVPMAFCYPGRAKSGDAPPLAKCAATWRDTVLAQLRETRLTLVVGEYAQKWHLKGHHSVTKTVRDWREFGEQLLPLPHPSPRNNIWLKKNPWFEAELVPVLQQRIRAALRD